VSSSPRTRRIKAGSNHLRRCSLPSVLHGEPGVAVISAVSGIAATVSGDAVPPTFLNNRLDTITAGVQNTNPVLSPGNTFELTPFVGVSGAVPANQNSASTSHFAVAGWLGGLLPALSWRLPHDVGIHIQRLVWPTDGKSSVPPAIVLHRSDTVSETSTYYPNWTTEIGSRRGATKPRNHGRGSSSEHKWVIKTMSTLTTIAVCYQNILTRSGSAAEWQGWANLVTNVTLSLSHPLAAIAIRSAVRPTGCLGAVA